MHDDTIPLYVGRVSKSSLVAVEVSHDDGPPIVWLPQSTYVALEELRMQTTMK